MKRKKPLILPPSQVRTMIRRRKDAVERWSKTGLDEQKALQERAHQSSAAWENFRKNVQAAKKGR